MSITRVSTSPRCPICNHPDWCGISADGAFAICMRISDGSVKPTRNGGWLHRLADDPGPRTYARTIFLPRTRRADFSEMAQHFQKAVDTKNLTQLAHDLGVSCESLTRLGIGWFQDSRAWSFPMTTPDGTICGIRLRKSSGAKFAVRGSKDGLFIPYGIDWSTSPLLICEGPTDTAALLDIGFALVVGRPSCTGGIKQVCELVRSQQPELVVVVADRDEPGQRGANNLATCLVCYCPKVKVISPPNHVKDARQWLNQGGTKFDVLTAIHEAPVRKLTFALREVSHG